MSNFPTSGKDAFPVPDMTSVDLVSLLKAIADPARLVILARLSDGGYHPCTVDEYGLSIHKSTLSYHFKTLREAGLTVTRVRGREHAVRLRSEELAFRFPGLIESVTEAVIRYETTQAGQ